MLEALRSAMTGPDREAAEAVRDAVAAFAGAVCAISVKHRGTVAAMYLDEVVEVLKGAMPAAAAAPSSPPPVVSPTPDPVDLLADLVATVLDDQRCWLGRQRLPVTPAERWQWLFLQSWRLPETERDAVLKRARELADTDEGDLLGPAPLVPPCPAFGHEGLWANATAASALLDDGPVVGKLAQTLDDLATVAESCPDLRLLFRSDDSTSTPGSPERMAVYRDKVLRFAPILDGDRLQLGRLLFEGIGSLCPWPLPAPDSLWRRRVGEAIQGVEGLNDRPELRLIIPDEPGKSPRQSQPQVVSIFSPEEQPDRRLWLLRIGVQDNGHIDARDHPRLLEAKTN